MHHKNEQLYAGYQIHFQISAGDHLLEEVRAQIHLNPPIESYCHSRLRKEHLRQQPVRARH